MRSRSLATVISTLGHYQVLAWCAFVAVVFALALFAETLAMQVFGTPASIPSTPTPALTVRGSNCDAPMAVPDNNQRESFLAHTHATEAAGGC
jgi:hypothetical protein